MSDEHADDIVLDEHDDEQQDADDAFEVELDGEDPIEETPLIKQLRRQNLDLTRDLAAERRREQQPNAEIVVGDEPTLEGCEWDEDKFKAETRAYDQRVARHKEQQQNGQQAQETANRSFQRAKADFDLRARRIKGVDMVQAEKDVASILSPQWVGAIIESSPVAERVIAALHKYPDQLQRIADEPQDWKKMRMIWDLESKVKTNMNKKPPPPPEAETLQRGSSPLSRQAEDKKAEKLLAEAQRSGDMTHYSKYMREKRKKA